MKEKISDNDRRAIDRSVPDRVAKDWLRNQELCMEVCTGSAESDCCGAKIKHGDICSDCGEHCSNQCTDCYLKDGCMNYNEKWD